MDLYYKPTVFKQLKKIPKTDIKKIAKKLKGLKDDPYAGKPLKGELEGLYALRAWPYRIIYEIGKKRLIIYSIAHRQGVYRI